MATAEETTETLALVADDGPPLSSEPVVSQAAKIGDDGDCVSKSCKRGLNGDMGSDGAGVIEVERGAIETEVSVEAVMGGGEESGKGLGSGSVLDVEKGEENGVEKIGSVNDLNVSCGDPTDGNGIFLVAEAIDSMENGNESQKKNKGVDRDSFDVNGEGLGEKLSVIKGSLSKVGDDHAIKGEGEVNATEENDEEEDDDDDIGDEDQEYHVGDFVWGKIRSFPWWPGQIYDPSDASDYAVKLKQKDRILVAYFGDGSFSWCNPSQLKPFVDNFEEMSARSNSKSFVNAVQKALDEISRFVELEITCSCLPEKDQLKDSTPINGGIKEGVLVHVGGIGKFLIAQHEPKEIIARLRNVAQEVPIYNLLELTVLKSWLTAYYRAKGGYTLPLYHYPKGIEGLEDKSIDGIMNAADLSNPVEVPVQGPFEEEWFSSPVAVGPGFNESNQSLLQKCPAISGDILYQRRKQKSVAELMDDQPSEKKGSLVNGKNSGKLTSGKRKKDNNEAEKQNKSLMASQSGMKRGRKKKAEASVSPRTTEKKTTSVETTDVGDEESDEIPLSRELKKRKLSTLENGEDGAEKETKKSLASRERKKSRYLSPPYTNPILQMKISSSKRGFGTESEESNKLAQFRERMTKVAGQLIGSQIHIKELGSRHEASSSLRPRTSKQDDRMVIDSQDVTAISSQLLSHVRSAAIDPLCPREKSFLDFITENTVAFRNSFFVNPSDYAVQEECQIGSRKRKSSSISSGPPQEELNGSEHELPEPSRSQERANGTNDQDFEMPLLKQGASVSEMKTNDEDAIRKAAPVALILTFPPAFSLPSKDELMQIFSKFGALNEMETDVFYNSYCARVSYLKSSNAKEAFRASVERNPFGAANVNYRLRYPSAAAKVHEINQTPSLENAIAPQPSDDEAHIGYIREKFKMMTYVLDSCGGRISVVMKSNLEDELKDILEKVSSIKCTSS